MLAEVGNFVFRAFRPQPADEERGEHPADRHDGVVGDEVHRVEEIFAAYLREVPADGERRGDAENGDGDPHDDRRLRAGPAELVYREGHDDLKEREGGGDGGDEEQREEGE